jgi:hypothetical protein
MTDAIHKAATRALTAPFRGTQPLPQSRESERPRGTQLTGDKVLGLSGSRQLEAFAREADPLEDVKAQAEQLLRMMSPLDRMQAAAMLNPLSQGPAEGETLAQFRAKLTSMLSKFKDLVDKGQDEQRVIRASVDMQWLIFYKSLERYLENLTAMAKVEASVLERRQSEGRSQAKFTERLLTAAAALAPEHRFSLLSAQLSAKN